MQRCDQRSVDLQQRFAAGQHHITAGGFARPLRGDGVGEFVRRGVAAAQRAVGADKVGVAELAGRGGAVLLAAAPEVAAGNGKTPPRGRHARLRPARSENLLTA
jgi:hypothetical protein